MGCGNHFNKEINEVKRGISFQIPNEYGRFLNDILEPLDCALYNWLIGNGQILQAIDDQLIDEELFRENETIISGAELNYRINRKSYYTIFADLKGFPKGKKISKIETYEDYLQSDCKIVLLITDSIYVSVYCKDEGILDRLYGNAKNKEYHSMIYN